MWAEADAGAKWMMKKMKHQLFSHLLPVYPCTQEHTLFLMHWPPFLQGGLHTAGVGERNALLGDL